MNNTAQDNARRFVVIDLTVDTFDELDRFSTYREAWEYKMKYPLYYVEHWTGGEICDEEGARIHVDGWKVYDQATEYVDGLTIVYDKGDGNLEDLPDEDIMLDAVGIDMETRQQYADYNWIYRDMNEMWLEELEAARRADS